MAGAGVTALVIVTIALLLVSGAWTERHYRRFDQLPAHYDFRGRPTRFASRRVMAWLLPVTFSVMLVAVALVAAAAPPGLQNGDPVTGLTGMFRSAK